MNLNDNDTNKERVVAFLPPDTVQKMLHLESEHSLKNHSEFVQEAVKFYIGFLASGDATEFLSATLHRTLNDSLLVMQNRVGSNLFRLSVELSMMMHLLGANLDVTNDELYSLRGRCVREVKNTKGKIKLDDAVAFQQGADEYEFT